MGEFRRQPSKVWWASDEDEDLSKFSGFLGWGKGIDLSGNLTDSAKNNSTSMKNTFNISKCEKDETIDENKSGSFFHKLNNRTEEEMDKVDNQRESLEKDRGSSSSPSQGSHKSQDSGFSDSEIQNNALSPSPQCSPELPTRLSCVKCKSREGPNVENPENWQSEKSYNETVVNYLKLTTSVKHPQCKGVEYNLQNPGEEKTEFLETAFDDASDTSKKTKVNSGSLTKEEGEFEVKVGPKVTSPKSKRNFIKDHISRTKSDTREKINQIQNQLELSFKLPKKINLSQNLKISNLFSNQFHDKPQEDQQNFGSGSSSPKKNSKESFAENASSLKSLSSSKGRETVLEKRESGLKMSMESHNSKFDQEGFKVPKLPGDHSIVCKGSNHFLDLTEIGGPPISSSTPKSCKFQGQESPVPKAARATEKKLGTRTTFAKIRKLKGLSDKKCRGSANNLPSFYRCVPNFSDREKVNIDFESSVKHWLSEMETIYEAEIMTTLQSKSLATDLTRHVTNMADTTSQTVRKLHQKTKIISLEFSKLCQYNKNKKDQQIGPLIQSLVGHITEFIEEYVQKKHLVPQITQSNHQRNDKKSQRLEEKEVKSQSELNEVESCHEMITDFRQIEPETMEVKKESSTKTKEEEVLEASERLRRLLTQSQFDYEKIEAEVSTLGQKFTDVVDILLESHIQALVRVLEEPKTELALRTALSALTTLGLEGNHLSHVVSKCGGIRALLAVCLEARATAARVSALRALATVCCISETIRQFEQAGGVEILADILTDEKRSEAELSEASAVIAQITAPWVQDNHSIEGLSQFLNSLVTSLTHIVSKYKSCETLLLSSAALANLTFMEPRTVWPLLENETPKILLTAVRRQGPKVSVFIQEQAATVIANMASVPECRKYLAEQRAVVALLCFLQIHHSPLQRAAEITAAERVQQKSAIALSRLCSDAMVAKQVIELQGVNRLVRLCKEERERNFSDGVLVACLAALRKIVANCGTEALEDLNAMELVEPRLLDSFLLYSSKQESYV